MSEKKKEYPAEVMIGRYRDRLKKITDKKFLTTMIFALAEVEKTWGDLMGYGKRSEDRTPEEKEYWDKWQAARTSILNNGNKQKRGLLNEIDMHDVIWNRYTTTFIPVNREEQ